MPRVPIQPFFKFPSPQLELKMASTTTNANAKQIVTEIPEWVRVFSDGTVERPRDFPIVPPTLHNSNTGVSSKDIAISNKPPKPISARIYLPNISNSQTEKLPIYVYFHGGGFFFESTFSKLYDVHLLKLVSEAKVMVVSVEYRLAPEHALPAGYDDCWEALKWVASHSDSTKYPTQNTEPWLIHHGDFNRVFIGGDSAGANIVHNILAFRLGHQPLPGDVKILGAVLAHPTFMAHSPLGLSLLPELSRTSTILFGSWRTHLHQVGSIIPSLTLWLLMLPVWLNLLVLKSSSALLKRTVCATEEFGTMRL